MAKPIPNFLVSPTNLTSYGFALISVLLAALLRLSLPGTLGPLPYLSFYPAVVIAAGFGGFGPGMLSVIVSWLVVDYFFDSTPGVISLGPAGLARLAVSLAGAAGISLISENLRRAIRRQDQQALALRESEYLRTLALIGAQMGTWNYDIERATLYSDERTQTILNVPPELSLQGFLDHIYMDDLPHVQTEVQRVLGPDSDGKYKTLYRVRGPDGSLRWIQADGLAVFTNEEPGRRPFKFVGTVKDVTERKRAEEDLAAARISAERARAAAESANRAKDHFLAVLSHELRTPLTPIVMGLSILRRRSDLDLNALETLEMIHSNLEMEVQLIDDLLDVTRIARGKIELNRGPVELCSIIQRAAEVCRADIEARRIHFGVDLGKKAPYWINADAPRLQQVFWNLLKNAIKFTPHGGCVGIRVRPINDHVHVEVNDSGIGIEPEALTRIFDAFEQAERSITRHFGGLGLGLAISKALVEIQDGKIEAHSRGRDKGATFRVSLPLIQAVQAQTVTRPKPEKQFDRPLRMLLVEDHGVTAQMIRMVLTEKQDNKVEIAGDVAAALELADKQPFDLLLSDLGLPDGSGLDLIRELRARGHTFPAIALSGYGQEADIRRSFEAGFAAHVTKPASRESILGKVHAAISSNEPLPTSVPSTANIGFTLLFDPAEALKRCCDNPETLSQLVNSYPTEFSEWQSKMRTARQKEDLPEIGRVTHKLKGTLFYLGAQPAADLAAKIEKASNSGQPEVVRKAISELEHQGEMLKQTLDSYSRNVA